MGCSNNMSMALLLLLLVAAADLATVTRSAWVGDYASNHGCGETAVAELCDPDEESGNRACSDACHYSGCGGGRCVFLPSSSGGASRGCHCRS